MHNRTKQGFTLAELLIALAILGVIAAFTIPKLLSFQQSEKNNAIVKEAASTVAGAYQQYVRDNGVTVFGLQQLMPYINYVKLNPNSSAINDVQGASGTWNCNGNALCLKMASGAIIYGATTWDSYSTTPGGAMLFFVDPDGTQNDATTDPNAPGHSVRFYLYSTGRLSSFGTLPASGTVSNWNGSVQYPNASPSADPPWFHW